MAKMPNLPIRQSRRKARSLSGKPWLNSRSTTNTVTPKLSSRLKNSAHCTGLSRIFSANEAYAARIHSDQGKIPFKAGGIGSLRTPVNIRTTDKSIRYIQRDQAGRARSFILAKRARPLYKCYVSQYFLDNR